MNKKTRTTIMKNFDTELSFLIANNRKISELDALRIFLSSKTHALLEDDELKLWYFSPLAIFDLWETEIATGDPRDSLYLRSDEIA